MFIYIDLYLHMGIHELSLSSEFDFLFGFRGGVYCSNATPGGSNISPLKCKMCFSRRNLRRLIKETVFNNLTLEICLMPTNSKNGVKMEVRVEA